MVDERGREYFDNPLEGCKVYEASDFIKGLSPFASRVRFGQIVEFYNVPGSAYPLMAQYRRHGDAVFFHGPESVLHTIMPERVVNGPEWMWPSHEKTFLHIEDAYFRSGAFV
jgi:hypothetical protein